MHQVSKTTSYIPSLDGLRAVSILLVFASHVQLSHLIPGGFGVTVFFFLSGFLITTLLIREYDSYGKISVGHFYLRRVLRLGPPIAATLGACILAVWLGWAQGQLDLSVILSQVFFYFNYHYLAYPTQNSVDGLGVLWSLSVEEHFYIFYPAFFIALTRGWIGLRGIVGVLVAVMLWRALRFYGLGHNEEQIYVSTDTRIDSMLFGCLLALMQARDLLRKWPEGWRAYLVVVAGLAVLMLTFLIRDPAFRSVIRYSLQGLALMPLFHYAVTHPQMLLFKPLNWSALRLIGKYSYTLYLIHFVVIKAMEYNGFDPGNPLVFVPLAGAISLGFAAAVYRFVEQPLMPLRKRLTGH